MLDEDTDVCLLDAAMHDLDPVFRSWCRSDRVAALLRALGFRRPLPVQSMYILKARRVCCRQALLCASSTATSALSAVKQCLQSVVSTEWGHADVALVTLCCPLVSRSSYGSAMTPSC